MFYVGKSLLHEALFGLSSESTSAHISTHSTTYSDGGRALSAAAGSRAAVTAIGGGRRTKATRLRRTAPPDGARPRPTAAERPNTCCRAHCGHRCATFGAAPAPPSTGTFAERSRRRPNGPENRLLPPHPAGQLATPPFESQPIVIAGGWPDGTSNFPSTARLALITRRVHRV